MIPTGDNLVRRTFPFVNYLFIIINIGVFLMELSAGGSDLVTRYGAIPYLVINAAQYPFAIVTLVTSMFLHGGWLHLAGNMIYLGVFGDNIEDVLGHFRYILFYFTGGLVASFTHIFMDPTSQVPMVGASGAIAAVLGAYLVFFSKARIRVIIIFFFFQIGYVSSLFILGFWFIIQLFNGIGSIAATSSGGVAYWAHIGGFVAGVIIAFIVRIRYSYKRKRRAAGYFY